MAVIGFGGAESCPEASIVGAQGALTVQLTLRSQAQGVGGAVDHVAGAALQAFAASHPVGWSTDGGQQAKCCSVFHRRISRPIAARRVGAVSTSMPSMRVKSTSF